MLQVETQRLLRRSLSTQNFASTPSFNLNMNLIQRLFETGILVSVYCLQRIGTTCIQGHIEIKASL